MTREEREDAIKFFKEVAEREVNNAKYSKLAIEALEQEPILDKIRAEIESKCDRINSLASVLSYPAHREIQELLCDILELLQAETEAKDGKA